jgi:hypothetical protein
VLWLGFVQAAERTWKALPGKEAQMAKSMGEDVPVLTVNRIREKDIDLLLLEECAAGLEFWRWFIAKAFPGLSRPSRLLDLTRSVGGEIQGESDLELTYTLPNGTTERLLVENKINAPFQPRQAARYRTRGEQYIARGTCDRFRTVLACPRRYLGPTATTLDFDAIVTYEQILDWFTRQAGLGTRAGYKRAVLVQAIASCQANYVRVADAGVTAFWYDYWHLVTARIPELELPEPGDRPARSSWIRFKPASFPHGVIIVHQLGREGVALEFAGLATHLALFMREFGDTLDPDMTLVPATKTLAIRVNVPLVDRKRSVEAQRAQIEQGQDAASRLYSWFQRHQDRLVPWLQQQRPSVFGRIVKKRRKALRRIRVAESVATP